MVESPPANAGDTGSIPGLGTKTPHATEQLGPQAIITEARVPRACDLKQEKPLQLEKALEQQQRLAQPKLTKLIKKKEKEEVMMEKANGQGY